MYSLTLLFLLLFSSNVTAMTIGSDSAVTRFNNQVTLADGDRIAGFAALDGGFLIAGPSVTATFDSFFQVSGPLQFNGGTLNLDQDLHIANVSCFGPLGSIEGNFHDVDFAQTVTVLPISSDQNECTLSFNSNISGADPFETVDWAFDNVYIGVGTSGFQPNVVVYEFDGSTLTQVEIVTPPGFSVDINAVRWHPSEYFLAVGIATAFFGGSELHIYSFDPGTTTLTLESSDVVPGAVTALAWHPDGEFLAVGTTANAEEVKLYPVDSMGNLGTEVNINIAPNRDVQLESLDFDSTGDYFAVGLNTSGANPTLLVYDFTPIPLGATLNASATTPATVAGLSWNQTINDVIAVGQAGVTTNRAIAYEHDGGGGTLTQIATISDFSIAVENVSWDALGNCLALGTVVSVGVGQARSYCFDETLQAFELASTFELADDVGGIGWSPNSSYLATGDDSNTLSVYQKTSAGDASFVFSNLKMILNNNISVNDTLLVFSGQATIDGRGNELNLMNTSSLIVDSDSSLSLKNIKIKGAGSQNINGTDITSTLTCEDVVWSLDSDFTFTQGALTVASELLLQGDQKQFIYRTEGIATIESFSQFMLDAGVTFSYDPVVSNKNLLQFTDASSQLVLDGGTLHASSTGLSLTKGTLQVDRASYITSAAINDAEAISVGNNVSSVDNFYIIIGPAASLQVASGRVLFQNV